MVTSGLPGIGGRIKDQPEDFIVTERPAYEPGGVGEHLYLWVEKREMSHEQMLDLLSRQLGVSRRDIGSAGMKDRRAVTRQWISVPERAEASLSKLEDENLRVLEVSRHTNSLKTGHLRGNDFEIVVRGVAGDAAEKVDAICAVLNRTGCPNYFGTQRFGFEGSTLAIGEGLVTGDVRQQEIPHNRRRFLVRLALSAVQSAVFNEVLADRTRDELCGTVLEGDVMSFPGSKTVFLAEDAGVEQARLDAGETVLTGPMLGIRMRGPRGAPAEREEAVYRRRGLRVGQFERWKGIAPGARRPMTVRPGISETRAFSEGGEDALRLRMSLPAGTYATVVLEELMKVESDGGGIA